LAGTAVTGVGPPGVEITGRTGLAVLDEAGPTDSAEAGAPPPHAREAIPSCCPDPPTVDWPLARLWVPVASGKDFTFLGESGAKPSFTVVWGFLD